MNEIARSTWLSLRERLSDPRYKLDPPEFRLMREYYIGFSHACAMLGVITDDEWKVVMYGEEKVVCLTALMTR